VTYRFDCLDDGGRGRGVARAASSVQEGALVVLPTDAVYGLGCDAFSPDAVAALRALKGHRRSQPPPVLMPRTRTLDGLATQVSDAARELADAFWPGSLTLLCRAQPTLDWDLGDTRGTVALRVPLHPVALQVLDRTGPLAVTAANAPGSPAPTSCEQARAQLGDEVEVYLDAGELTRTAVSTIVDVTGPAPQVLRLGALGLAELRAVVPGLLDELGRA
jgi:L-threonylcarbamoyladenylate synthase